METVLTVVLALVGVVLAGGVVHVWRRWRQSRIDLRIARYLADRGDDQ